MDGKGSGYYKWTVLLITSIGAFMTPFDSTIVSVSLPSIASSLSISYAMVIWVPTAYLVTLAVLLLSLGRLSDIKGRKPLFVSGFAVFIAASLLCSISYSGLQLIVFRAVQGAGAAFIGATSTAIVTDVFPSRERGKALGINAMSIYVGLSMGPSLGGFLTHTLGWRSIFYINIPIGILVITLALMKLREPITQIQGRRFDLLGASTFSLGLIALLVALTLGESYGWRSLLIIGLLIVGGVLLAIFTLVERKKVDEAMLDISLFSRNRLFAAANVSAFLNYTSYFGVSFFVSFYLQRVLDYSPLQAGMILLTMPVTMTFLSPISGWLSDRIGSRILSSLGMALICIGLLLMSTLGLISSSTDVVIRLFIIGFGMGLFSSPNTSAVMGSVEKSRLGVASGTLATMRFVGQSMSLAIMGAIVATVASSEVLSALFIGYQSKVVVAVETFLEGMRRAFIASAFIAALGFFTSLVRGKGK